MWWEFGDDKNVLRFLIARDKFPMIDAFKITLLGGSLLLVIILFVRPLECKGWCRAHKVLSGREASGMCA